MSESMSEDFLKEQGLIRHPSERRRQVLGCLACRWNDSEASGLHPVAYGRQIIKCTNVQGGIVYPLLQHLAAAGVVTSWEEGVDPREVERPQRVLYSPADTELGRAFEATLEIPERCFLPDDYL